MAKRNNEDEQQGSFKKRRNEGPVPPLFKVFHGEVASVKDYGLFVKIPGTNRQGLVHKSQISRSRVEDPSEMFARGEYVYCKVISINDEGEKIGLAMKTVNQTTGQDQDPNNVELSQDEKKRKQFGNRYEKQKIVLEAVLDTTCRKCGGKGHLAQDCFKTGDTSYDLIPDLDDYMQTVSTAAESKERTSNKKKKKKDKKKVRNKKEKKKKKHKRVSSSSESDTSDSESDHRHKKKKHKKVSSSDDSESNRQKHKRKKHRRVSSSDDSEDDRHNHKKKKSHKRRRRSSNSSSSD